MASPFPRLTSPHFVGCWNCFAIPLSQPPKRQLPRTLNDSCKFFVKMVKSCKIITIKGFTGGAMKRFYIFTVLFFIMGGVFFVNAQDMIILKDGNIIEARVLEISPTEIRYKRFDHLEGPTIVIMAVDVLSIRYENGRTEIINSATQPVITTPSIPGLPIPVQASDQIKPNPRLNTIGATIGYQGVSAFGFTLNGTVSPGNYTFFDFNLGLGFMSFAFNGRINFNAFVPFKIGGWYAGGGIGGGYSELLGGFFAGNITTGFILFNWLNIGYTLQIGTFDGVVNHNAFAGYSYRFKQKENSVTSGNENNSTVVLNKPSIENYTVENVTGDVKKQTGRSWVNVRVGDIITNETVVMINSNSSLSLVMYDGSKITTRSTGRGFLSIFLRNI